MDMVLYWQCAFDSTNLWMQADVANLLNYLVAAFFFFDFCVKLMAQGVLLTPRAYLQARSLSTFKSFGVVLQAA